MLKSRLILIVFATLIFQKSYAQDLLDTYHLALKNEPDLKSSNLNRFAVTELKSQSIAQMLPSVGLHGSSSKTWFNNNKQFTFQGGRQNFWNYFFTIDLKQPVFHWDHWVELDQSENRIAQAEAQYQAHYQKLLVITSNAYFNILAAQDNLRFAVAEKNANGKQLEQAKQRFDVGVIAITDVYAAQAAFDQAFADEIEAINLLDDDKERLQELIGENESALNPLQADMPLVLPEPEDINIWSETAQSSNFNIVAQLNKTEIARKEINRQKSGHLPTLDIVASYGVQDDTSSFGNRGDAQTVGLQLNLPIFEGGAVASRSKHAQYVFQQEKESLVKVRRTVTRQVRNAYRGVTSSLNRVKALKTAIKSAENALEATEAGFNVGSRTMVDVLSEQRNLFRSKRNYARSRYDYVINGIKLKAATGNLAESDLRQVNQFLIR